MSTKDTAGDKLVASIRKTKTTADARSGTTKKTAVKARPQAAASAGTSSRGAATAKKAGVRKASPAKAARSPSAPKATAKTSSQKAELVDLFQHGRRVWPD